jgi:hypothetical protein
MDVADERDREVDNPLQDAAGIHQFSGEQEQRNRHEMETVGALGELEAEQSLFRGGDLLSPSRVRYVSVRTQLRGMPDPSSLCLSLVTGGRRSAKSSAEGYG